MKTKFFKSLLVTMLISFCTFAQNQAKAESKVLDKEQIKKEIQARENEYAEIYNSGKLKKVGYYSKEAKVFHQNRKPLNGLAEITAYLEADIITNTNKISFETNEVMVSNDGMMVVEVGYYTVKNSSNAIINTGNYMCLFEKKDGKYVCVREMSASDME